ncbi:MULTISPECIES: YwqG family protein [unclassified Lysinibacillus]|uniref:YwqG family protein n=1 Tax=unclassified Lysinibacillus TaxID=2636778 RepID=UPI00380BA17C
MSETISLKLPKEVEQFRNIIEGTMEPVVVIETHEKETTLFESKFAGNPYFPLSMEYPKNAEQQPLKLLAQINFADVPKHLPHFPNEGILQFYIDGYDDVLGMDFDSGKNQNGFRVIFHDTIVKDESQLIQDFSFVENQEEELYFPVDKEMALSFKAKFEPLSMDDFRSNEIYASIETAAEEDEELTDVLYDVLTGDGHKIGGYPFFTQEDPRAYGNYTDSTTMLLQIDSEGDHIMWGDCGVCNFFITEEELKNKDFSKVVYNWDCH